MADNVIVNLAGVPKTLATREGPGAVHEPKHRIIDIDIELDDAVNIALAGTAANTDTALITFTGKQQNERVSFAWNPAGLAGATIQFMGVMRNAALTEFSFPLPEGKVDVNSLDGLGNPLQAISFGIRCYRIFARVTGATAPTSFSIWVTT